MEIRVTFVNKADAVASRFEGVSMPHFDIATPNIGDKFRLRMQPGNVIHEFVCTGRNFDFSQANDPLLTVELDLA
jgi:hypothetical protein